MSRHPAGAAAQELSAFLVTPPGFEVLAARELRHQGIRNAAPLEGGVAFFGNWEQVYVANLWSRIGSRVLVRLARFQADSFPRLEKELRRLPWGEWLPRDAPLDLRVSKQRTPLYHTGKVAEVVLGVLAAAIGARAAEGSGDALRIQVRIHAREVTVSLDTSGEHLHRRGYRAHAGEAPLRENLAAGLLAMAGYRGAEPLLDPMCGSGTLPVEAALLARRIPPGRGRPFAFQRLPGFEPGAWERLRGRAEERIRPVSKHPVYASDRDPRALALAARAATEAGVAADVQIAVAEVVELEAPCAAGLLVANPPYGRRLAGARAALRSLGQALAGPFRGWRWGVVVSGTEGPLGLQPDTVSSFRNGGLRLGFALGGARVGADPTAPAVEDSKQ